MRLEQLQYLDELDRTHSMSLASDILFVSQQNISKAIRSLEEELGVQLLNRSSKGITLTPAGQRTVAAAREIFNQINKLNGELECHRAAKTLPIVESLRIGYMELATDPVSLANCLSKMNELSPYIEFYVHRYSLEQIIERVSDNRLDIGILFYLPYLESFYQYIAADLTFETINTAKFYVCFSNIHPLNQRQALAPADIAQYPIVMVQEENTVTHLFYKYLSSAFQYSPTVGACFNDSRLLYHFLEENPTYIHLLLLSAHHINAIQKDYHVSFIPFQISAQDFKVCFLYKESTLTASARLFKRLSKQYHKVF